MNLRRGIIVTMVVTFGLFHAQAASAENSTESAISWAKSYVGSTAYEGYCEMFIERAYGTPVRHASARAHWDSIPSSVRFTDKNPSKGALVFYNYVSGGVNYGHVGISLGDGTIISTSASGRKVGISSISYFSGYLGWSWSFAALAPSGGFRSADINRDRRVNVYDQSILLSKWGKAVSSTDPADLKPDRVINVYDLSFLLGHWTG